MKLRNILSIFLIQTLFYSCFVNKNNSQDKIDLLSNDFKMIAIKEFNSDTAFVFNENKRFVLCLNNRTEQTNPNAITKFFVYSIPDKKIVYQSKIAGASISWKSDTELWIKVQKGIITSTSDTGKTVYILDLRTNKKSEYINKSNK